MVGTTFIIVLGFTTLFLATPTLGITTSETYNEHPEGLSAIYINVSGVATVFCSGALINNHQVITSCYCMDWAFQQALSARGMFYLGEVRYALGMTSIDSKIFNQQKAQGMVYDVPIFTENVTCPNGYNFLQQNDFDKDIAILEIPPVDLEAYKLNPISLSVDDDPEDLKGVNQILVHSWGSNSCKGRGDKIRHVKPIRIVDCPVPRVKPLPSQFCSRFNDRSTRFTLGDAGGVYYVRTPSRREDPVVFGLVSYQRKNETYGTGCTGAGQAQVNTKLKSYKAFLKKVAPDTTYVKISK